MISLEHSPCPAFINQFKKLNTYFPKLNLKKIKFYTVVDSVEWVSILAKSGVKTIQLRLKNKSYAEIKEAAMAAQNICKFYDCQFFLNDYWEIAVELNLFGVHLGFEDLQTADLKKIESYSIALGLSTHSYFELATAISLNPSYIALGPIYKTQLKKMRFMEQGLERVQKWRQIIPHSIPLVAIGGITLEDAQAVYSAGANSIAVVSDVTANPNPADRVRRWLNII